jgi:hypothetical protein
MVIMNTCALNPKIINRYIHIMLLTLTHLKVRSSLGSIFLMNWVTILYARHVSILIINGIHIPVGNDDNPLSKLISFDDVKPCRWIFVSDISNKLSR